MTRSLKYRSPMTLAAEITRIAAKLDEIYIVQLVEGERSLSREAAGALIVAAEQAREVADNILQAAGDAFRREARGK